MNMFKLNSTSPLILYPQMEHCWNYLTRIHQDYIKTGIGSNCQVLGVSGLGKSTLLKNYAGAHPERSDDSGVIKPVVYFAMPSAPTPRSIMGAISKAFNGPDVGTAEALMDRAVHYLKRFRVEVLLGDEAHHLIDRGRMKTHAHLGDCWKELNDRVTCCMCLAGAPRLMQLFETNNQLRNRAGENLVLAPFPYKDQVSLGQFVLCAIQGGPLEKHQVFFTDSDVLSRIQYATDGVHVHVVRFIDDLSKVSGDSKGLALASLDKAWRMLGSGNLPPTRRPFHREFNFDRLCGLGEPFRASAFDGDNHVPYF